MIGASGNFKHSRWAERLIGKVAQRAMQVKGFIDCMCVGAVRQKEGKKKLA